MSYALSGRTALITGSTSGIDRACAATLTSYGAHVLVTGRPPHAASARWLRSAPPVARPPSSPPTWALPAVPRR